MIITQFPSRISLSGGSTDQEDFLNKYGQGMVINFPCNIFNKIIIDIDKLGKNNYDNKYVISYSKREEKTSIKQIKNDIVKISLEYQNYSKKFTTIFLSDINSVGSGLACSSAYTLSFNRAIEILKSKIISDYERCCYCYEIEKKFNPKLGMQDTFGCGISGLKCIYFKKDEMPKIEYLNMSLFDNFDMYLMYTGITRKSTEVLKSLNFINDNLLKTCEKFLACIHNNNYSKIMDLIKEGWKEKKQTSKMIVENSNLIEIDTLLCEDKNILSHKLCGAGNGGYFLFFVEKGIIPSYKNCILVNPLENINYDLFIC